MRVPRGTILAFQTTIPIGRLLFTALSRFPPSIDSETELGRSMRARFILTLTPASVRLDISRQPSLHHPSLSKARLREPSTVLIPGWTCEPWKASPW
jgi:hypothetical protein